MAERDLVVEAAPYRFGPFQVSPAARTLLRDGVPVELGGRALDVLILLLQRAGEVIDKDAIIQAVWRGQAVEATNLRVQLSTLRRVLGHDANGEPLIVTVPRRGYMFAGRLAAAPTGMPASRPGPQPPVTLPHPGTSFIGRTDELAAVRARLQSHRLVTITGMGGIGKTRLMLQLLADLTPEMPDRLFPVDLAPITDPAGVAEAVARSIGAGLQAAAPEEAILASLRWRPAVLAIDNAEHVLPELRPLLRAILAGCTEVRVLVTSRISLDIPAENVFRVQPLLLPPEGVGCLRDQAMGYEAVRLFVDRAEMLLPDFRLDDDNRAAVVDICRRLDGIALAIEMAVPRLLVLNAEQLRQRLDQRFNLLVSRPGEKLSRQGSLRAMLDWSWDLLDPGEQSVLLLLAAFVGTASLSAVVAMRSAADYPEWAVLDRLAGLVRASLVIAEPGGDEPRYRLLETTRAFAQERMGPAFADELRRKHLAVMVRTFEQAEAAWPTMRSPAWLNRYGPDADNVRAALHWALGPGNETELGLRLVSVSYPLWWELPNLPLRESRSWFDLAVARISAHTPATVQARLWLGHSWRDVEIGDAANLPAANRAVALFEAMDDPIGLGAALWRAGCSLLRPETLARSDALLLRAEQVLRSRPPTKWLALTLIRRADICLQFQDSLAASKALYDEAMEIARSTDFWFGVMLAGNCLAEWLFHAGFREAALDRLIGLRAELPRGRRNPVVSNLATHLASAGRTEEALDAIREVVQETPGTGLLVALARAIEALAMILAEAGQTAPAARMLGFVLTIHQTTRRRTCGRLAVYIRLNAALGDDEGIAALRAEGAAWSESDALREAHLALSRPLR